MTVSATVLVVVHLAPVVPRTTTHSTQDPRWILQRQTSEASPSAQPPAEQQHQSADSLPMVVLAKVPVVATVVWPPSVLCHVPTVGRRRHHFGAVTTSAIIFVMLVVSPFNLPPCCYHSSAVMMCWHVLMGRRSKLSYHITDLFFFFFS